MKKLIIKCYMDLEEDRNLWSVTLDLLDEKDRFIFVNELDEYEKIEIIEQE